MRSVGRRHLRVQRPPGAASARERIARPRVAGAPSGGVRRSRAPSVVTEQSAGRDAGLEAPVGFGFSPTHTAFKYDP